MAYVPSYRSGIKESVVCRQKRLLREHGTKRRRPGLVEWARCVPWRRGEVGPMPIAVNQNDNSSSDSQAT